MAERGVARCGRGRRLAGLALGLLGHGVLWLGVSGIATATDASADCLRRVYNRSSLVLVARRDGGPPVTLLPGESVPLRLSRPGTLALAAYCAAPGPTGGLTPVAEAIFPYVAVLDRCFIEFGSPLFTPQLGRGFFGTQGTAPFTVNNPRQGDVILGPLRTEACPVLSRRG